MEPLRQIHASTLGRIVRNVAGNLEFVVDSLASPPLGAHAVPLSRSEHRAIVGTDDDAHNVRLGELVRGGGPLEISIQVLFRQHVAVLGGTGQGKTSLAASIMQQLVELPRSRIVVFDINGEYDAAFTEEFKDSTKYERTVLGDGWQIPYYALGRSGLARLLLPSERTQRPALNFGLSMLPFVAWDAARRGVGLAGEQPALFDDCRIEGADRALEVLQALRGGGLEETDKWPPMAALGCLIAESHVVRNGRNGPERNAFDYGHVAPLVTRVQRFAEDVQFMRVVGVEGGTPVSRPMSWDDEGRAIVEKVFGGQDSAWKIHVVDLRRVAHDLLPAVMGSILELLAFEIFRRGQGQSHPTVLVLEEAHHYLREARSDEATGGVLAYERLAKEGRKFGVSMWISTQRPSEVSPTVLAQCGSWVVFRLSNASDLHAVERAADWGELGGVAVLGGLPRREAFVFGAPVPVPAHFIAGRPEPQPESRDPNFTEWFREV